MALTLNQMSVQLDALKKARNSGALIVRHGDTMTQFRTLKEMNEVIAALEADIAAASSSGTRVRAVRVFDKSGW